MNRGETERLQTEKLCRLLREVSSRNPFYRDKLSKAGWSARCLDRLDRPLSALLAEIPFTTKEELQRNQEEFPPYGTDLTYPLEQYQRLHQTSGSTGQPLRWLDTAESWEWLLKCWDTIYGEAGLHASERVFLPFSFGPFIGFWGAFEGAFRRGRLVLAGGGLGTDARLHLMIENRMTVVVCTPSYALHMAEVAVAEGIDLSASTVRALIVAGEPGGSIPATRARLETAWGARVFDHCGLSEVGALGYERVDRPGDMLVIEPEFIAEVARPGGAEPVASGEEGELVVTNLGRAGSPVIRYRTGDLVRVRREASPQEEAYCLLEGGILARLDDMVIVRGNNVYPSALEGVLRAFPEIVEYRVRVTKTGELSDLVVEIEPAPGSKGTGPGGELQRRVREALQRALLFRSVVRVVAPGSLPRFEAKARRFILESTTRG